MRGSLKVVVGGADLSAAGSKEGPWLTNMCDLLPPTLPGCVPFQCCADDSSHHGELCFPQVGPGRGLAHGAVFHGPHPWVHGLHVPHLKGLPEAGKPLLHPLGHWSPSPAALGTAPTLWRSRSNKQINSQWQWSVRGAVIAG